MEYTLLIAMVVSFMFWMATCLSFLKPSKSITYINPDWKKVAIKNIFERYHLKKIKELEKENRKLKKKLEDYQAVEENTRFKKTKISSKDKK